MYLECSFALLFQAPRTQVSAAISYIVSTILDARPAFAGLHNTTTT